MSNKNFTKNNNSSQENNSKKQAFFSDDDISVGTPWRLMIFSFLLLIFSIFIYFGLKYGYDMYLNKQLESLDEQSEQLVNKITEDEQAQFLAFYSQLNNLESILNNRYFSHNMFKFLENNTLPSVYYSSAQYSQIGETVALSGIADTMRDLVEQISVFNDSDKIIEATMNHISIEQDNHIGFNISISFNSNFLKKPFN